MVTASEDIVEGEAAMKVVKASTRPTKVAAAEYFTGTVLQDEVVVGTPPSRLRALSVTFNPGARTAWHKHPVGQTLYVLYGSGRVCREGEKPIAINPGDTVVIPPDVFALARRSGRWAYDSSRNVGGHRHRRRDRVASEGDGCGVRRGRGPPLSNPLEPSPAGSSSLAA
jgi:quercetin dioxygenase-like cupin family protein